MPLLQESPILELTRDFPIDNSSLSNSDRALYIRFLAASNLHQALGYIAEHEKRDIRSDREPDLGMLNTYFDVSAAGQEYGINIVPMGASDEILLGCFGLSALNKRLVVPRQGDVVDFVGTDITIAQSTVGYAGLDRESVREAGTGLMRYSGKLAVFNSVPSDEELLQFASSTVESENQHINLGFSRIDQCLIPAINPWTRF